MVYRETFFANPTASSSAPYPQESNPWVSNVSEHTSPHVIGESQTLAQDQRCQSGPPARISVIPSEGQFLTEGLLWIKEVEMVESVDVLKSSCSLRGIRMPDFEVRDAKIAPALNKIIQKFSLEMKGQSGGTKGTKTGPFPSWKEDRLPDLRVLPGHWSQ